MRALLSPFAKSAARRWAWAWAAALGGSAVVGGLAIRAILERAGRPAVPLDDVFIHFQFARRLAEGDPLRYTGEAVSSGATSLVWPALLAPFWWAGARGISLVWVAWAFGTIAHAGVAIETGRLAKRLTNGTGAVAAAAMCLAFGPFAWFAWSGMETMALAWVLVRATRLAGEVLDGGDRGARERGPAGRNTLDPKAIVELAVLGLVAPLVRPEGALAAAMAVIAIGAQARGSRRWLAIVPVLGVAAPPLLFWALTGDPASSTARAKWLVYNPYFDAGRLAAQIGYHARLLLFDVWDGGEWTWIFVPKGLVLAFMLGAVTLIRAGRRAPWTAALTLTLLLGAFATCSYQTFLWNRMRYVWPFVPAGFVLCACLAHEIGQLLRRVRAPMEMAAPILGGVIVARLAALLPDTFEDLSTSARAVDQQQVKLGEWARRSLPEGALVGVNDTGAIAYLGEKRTFDIVGLTTAGAAASWVAGAGSRFERFEALPRASLPTHFVVYPEWFGCDDLLGKELARAEVLDHAILGGDTMVAYEADFSGLGSGATPFAPPEGFALVDEVDVADLASEASHGFALGDAWDTDNVVRSIDPAGEGGEKAGRRWIDGGRLSRARDSFRIDGPPDRRDWILVMRVAAEEPLSVRVIAAGEEAATVAIPVSSWYEVGIPLREAIARTPATQGVSIEVLALGVGGVPAPARSREAGPRFASFHYWLFAR